ncbi:MAG: hypothetical protein AB7Q29_14810 [Vicinamibacterales bacterium]
MTNADAAILRATIAAALQEALVPGLRPLVMELQALRGALQAVLVPGDLDQTLLCEHPVEARITFGSMGGPEEWECAVSKGGCGFRFPEGVTT